MVGWGTEPPWGNKSPLVLCQFYVFEICFWRTNTTLPPIDYSDEKKQTLAKNAVRKYFAFNALLHVCYNRCVFVMFYYSNKIKHL